MGKGREALAIITQIILFMTEVILDIEELKNKTSRSETFRKPSYGGKWNHTITKVEVICCFDTEMFWKGGKRKPW